MSALSIISYACLGLVTGALAKRKMWALFGLIVIGSLGSMAA